MARSTEYLETIKSSIPSLSDEELETFLEMADAAGLKNYAVTANRAELETLINLDITSSIIEIAKIAFFAALVLSLLVLPEQEGLNGLYLTVSSAAVFLILRTIQKARVNRFADQVYQPDYGKFSDDVREGRERHTVALAYLWLLANQNQSVDLDMQAMSFVDDGEMRKKPSSSADAFAAYQLFNAIRLDVLQNQVTQLEKAVREERLARQLKLKEDEAIARLSLRLGLKGSEPDDLAIDSKEEPDDSYFYSDQDDERPAFRS